MSQRICRVLVTGAHGFIGKNLVVRMGELSRFAVTTFVRGDDVATLPRLLSEVDAVIHLAGENRPEQDSAFADVNAGLTSTLCDAIQAANRKIPLVLASSTQAERNTPYGRSKLAAEEAVRQLASSSGTPVVIFRLPGVFGKWCKPNYNSVVATFCHNIARNLSIEVHEHAGILRLVYVDDVVAALIGALDAPVSGVTLGAVAPEYTITLADLATQIEAFRDCRTSLMSQRVGSGLVRALYATYVSYLTPGQFSYDLPQYADARGVFVEMLKTPDCGQFSYFTAHPGVTRGAHYHHTKSEKFLVIKGHALFRFRHLLTGERFELTTSGEKPQVVDTVPGWAHDITNVGGEEMVVMLWANENFDRQRPDTINSQVS
jgi:UDP-2-acetamido-2,6-beta-L-arabino-hexul-4-ose reductase